MQEMGIGTENSGARGAYRVKRLEVVPGGISAAVQDKELGACAVEVRLVTLSAEQWERVAEVLGGQPLVSTQLISGTVPSEMEQVFAEAGAHLLPTAQAELACQCSCCSPGACRHLPLVFTLFAEMLADDPSLLLLLRGRDRQQLLRAANEARPAPAAAAPVTELTSTSTSTSAAAYTPVRPAEPDLGLAADLDQYWGNRKLIKQFHHHIAPPTVELSLLRRLGPINTSPEAMALYEQMVSLYRRITAEALALAYAADGDAPVAPNGNGNQADHT
jgi:uncharacterized Zn finger protein